MWIFTAIQRSNKGVKMKTISISDETYEKLKGEIEKLESKGGALWLPKNGEYYYRATTDSTSCFDWNNDFGDQTNFIVGNVFKTKQEAEAYQTYLNALFEIKKWIAENCEAFVPDWEDGEQAKWVFCYYHEFKQFSTAVAYGVEGAYTLPYLKSDEECQALIEAQEDNLKIIFGVK
jgi:hypothetical protein